MNRVPNITAVIRGASVNIVLKADQPTGRTVAGQVQDILTRGNHPRGIKVRLTDGRVGRVQSMAGQGQQQAPPQENITETGPPGYTAESSRSGGGGGRRQHKYRDVRLEEEEELPAQAIGLDAYIKPAKAKKGAARSQESRQDKTTDELVKCPVCGEFEGDAAAVEHHVATHFD